MTMDDFSRELESMALAAYRKASVRLGGEHPSLSQAEEALGDVVARHEWVECAWGPAEVFRFADPNTAWELGKAPLGASYVEVMQQAAYWALHQEVVEFLRGYYRRYFS
jgi:hypothetical protein